MSDRPSNRRGFLGRALGLSTVIPSAVSAAAPAGPTTEVDRVDAGTVARKSLLILGGTGFIGPHLVRRAIERGYRLSIFTRGQKTVDLPAQVERLVGDRNGKLEALVGRRWDAVIDDSATNPEWVRQSAELLRDHVGRYLFTSSTGVYYPYRSRGLNEADMVHTVARDPKDGSESYGTNKAACEAIVQRVFGDRGLVVRPTYIVGPGDTTDRFTYWPVRLQRGGDVLAPGRPDDAVQFIDVRDLTAFMMMLVEGKASGIFNAVGPRPPMTVRAFLEIAKETVGRDVTYTWVDNDAAYVALGVDGIVPWILARGNDYGHTSIVTTRSIAAGLTLRPVTETLRDTLAWFSALPEARQASAKWVITAEQERALLAAHRAGAKSGV